MENMTIVIDQKVKDPICGMMIEPAEAAGRVDYKGQNYFFCSKNCLERFRADPEKYLKSSLSSVAPAALDAETIYTCPMHPEIRQNGPGTCRICGMALEPLVATAGEEENSELKDMTRRFWISTALTVPAFALAMSEMIPGQPVQHWLPGRLSTWIQFVLTTPVILWGGWPFFQRGWASLKNRSLNMFTLIAIGTGAAYVYSVIATLFPSIFPSAYRTHGDGIAVYFEAASVITTLVLLGQVLELRARSQTNSAIKALLRLAPKSARVVRPDGLEEDIPLDHVKPGDRLRVRPGEKIPVDGFVIYV
jgi:Cu+-exporting ATPase